MEVGWIAHLELRNAMIFSQANIPAQTNIQTIFNIIFTEIYIIVILLLKFTYHIFNGFYF